MASDEILVQEVQTLGARLADARASIEGRFVGQHHVVEQVLAAILSGGHALLVGQPGLGKTMLVDTLSTVLGLDSQRIQFTPDLMPADILGSEVLDVLTDGSRAFRFIEGPVFTQLLMADEINRASPRTQSALLQAMQEREVTVSGRHRPLGRPFHVLATQNPIEQEGTYPLPEAQLDRFLLQIDVDYLGAIRNDPHVEQSVRSGKLFLTNNHDSAASQDIFKISLEKISEMGPALLKATPKTDTGNG